jgi:GTP-binding protein
VQQHLRRALHEADAFLLLCDAQQGLVPMDMMIMESLRKTGKPVFVATNKADSHPTVPPDCYALGVSPVIPISALHGRGIGELLDEIISRIQPTAANGQGTESASSIRLRSGRRHEWEQGTPCAVAVVGRQNVGKSSLVNALVRDERVIVSELPGTTRDAIDLPLTVGGQPVTLIDTAGLRHRRKVTQAVDLFSMTRTIEALARCEVALVLLDATQGVTRDDQRILTRVIDAGCGFVILANKWDLVVGSRASRKTEATMADAVKRAAAFASFAPIMAVSARTGFQVMRGLTRALEVARRQRTGLSDRDTAVILQRAWTRQPPPRVHGRLARFQQARWVPGRPIHVSVTTAPKSLLPLGYQRYLIKQLHADSRCAGIPLRLRVNET